MKKYKFENLSLECPNFKGLKYEILKDINKYSGSSCIIVKTPLPDLVLLFGSLKLLITETGSLLSHLSIVARENNIPVILVPEIISKIKEKGVLNIENGFLEI